MSKINVKNQCQKSMSKINVKNQLQLIISLNLGVSLFFNQKLISVGFLKF